MFEKIQNAAGGFVDNCFLALPRLINRIRPARTGRESHDRTIAYYHEHGHVADPESFFMFPDKAPRYTIMQSRPWQGGRKELVSYTSEYTPRNPALRKTFQSYDQNKTGYLVRWTHGDTGRNTVLCLHGYMLGDPRQAEKMFKIKKLFALGLDVALFIAPLHWKRAPRSPLRRGIFLLPENPALTWEHFGQAMFDLHCCFLILKSAGSGGIGIIGASLGGYLGALYSALRDGHAFAALMVPAVDFSRPLGPGSINLGLDKNDTLTKKIHELWTIHSPLNFTPKISPEKILVIGSQGDRLCPSHGVRTLCEKWKIRRCHLLAGGHWLIFNNVRGKEWYRFLGEMGFLSNNPPRS
ncbi:MAG TPA: hypothetical protein PK926_08280 [Spirochaetota bacterium]|nr:hypothetical protein [Spirochaetota bacterium]HPI88493.1 hypothetical protein [Spirochaetota bacterium]HPR47973.1 hypothetical protein [Spirochaetota bacterium]